MTEEIDVLMAAAIGALFVIFLASLAILIYICWRQRRNTNWERLEKIKGKKKSDSEPELALALSEIGLGNALEQILNDEHWMQDASGLLPICLEVLRTCHSLTERLCNLAMMGGTGSKSSKFVSPNKLIDFAKRIPSRVDDVVKSMYPPLDPRLLEARTAALILAVGQLTLLVQTSCGINKSQLAWIESGLDELDGHLAVLRKASNEIEATYLSSNANSQV
ncbi:transmembrane protein 98-like [Culicoides brevitarsis]|uniref:transmembrane protein 98-like n=1 Tax=Culicoides brevitarsis TaxID=469753 RepID=UPI00307BB618